MDRRRRLNAEFNRRAGRHARQASQGRDCTPYTRIYADRCPGTPARCGRASSEPGTSGRRDARWQRAERRTIAAEVLASRFLRTVVTAALSSPVISRKPSRNRTVILPVAGSQFNIAQFTKAILPKSSSAISRTYLQRKFAKKGPRGFHRRSKSGRKRPGAGSDGDHRFFHIANGRVECIDESQFGSRLKLFATSADIRQGVDDLSGINMVQ
jgi:hypothetical protein